MVPRQLVLPGPQEPRLIDGLIRLDALAEIAAVRDALEMHDRGARLVIRLQPLLAQTERQIGILAIRGGVGFIEPVHAQEHRAPDHERGA